MNPPKELADGSRAPADFAAFQNEVYGKGMLHGIYPTVTTDPNKLEEQARRTMSAKSYAYVGGGAGERATMDANRLAFRQWKLVPRMLRPRTTPDLNTTLFGTTYKSPILVAPIGVQQIFHDDKETGVAEIASELGVPFVMSTAASSSIEDVAKASGSGPRWYQLYWPQDNEITLSLLGRAKAAGFTALVVTLDTWALAWRPWDLDHAYVPFIEGIGNDVAFTDPVFRRKFREKAGKDVEDAIVPASLEWQRDAFSGKAHSWDEVKFLRDNWDGPLVLKGIQCVEDARLAKEAGADGIIVSNHGGRQLDGAIGSLEVLPEIADAVGAELTVLFDSGVRTGVDVIKALCLGARAVLVGRPWVYGLGVAGKRGARDVLRGILADLDQSLGLAGIENLEACTRDRLRRVGYGADRYSSA